MLLKAIPQPLLHDRLLASRLKVALAEALTATMEVDDWKAFATAHGLERRIIRRKSFLETLEARDLDHEGEVLDLLIHLFRHDHAAFLELASKGAVMSHFELENPDVMELWADPVNQLM